MGKQITGIVPDQLHKQFLAELEERKKTAPDLSMSKLLNEIIELHFDATPRPAPVPAADTSGQQAAIDRLVAYIRNTTMTSSGTINKLING